MWLFLGFLKALYHCACRRARHYATAHYPMVEISGLKVWTPARYHLFIRTTLKTIEDRDPALFRLIRDHISFIHSSPDQLDLGYVEKALILNNGYEEQDDRFWENPDHVWSGLAGGLATWAVLSREVSAGRLRVLFRGSKVMREAKLYGHRVAHWFEGRGKGLEEGERVQGSGGKPQ